MVQCVFLQDSSLRGRRNLFHFLRRECRKRSVWPRGMAALRLARCVCGPRMTRYPVHRTAQRDALRRAAHMAIVFASPSLGRATCNFARLKTHTPKTMNHCAAVASVRPKSSGVIYHHESQVYALFGRKAARSKQSEFGVSWALIPRCSDEEAQDWAQANGYEAVGCRGPGSFFARRPSVSHCGLGTLIQQSWGYDI